jgi:hypothetical protein
VIRKPPLRGRGCTGQQRETPGYQAERGRGADERRRGRTNRMGGCAGPGYESLKASCRGPAVGWMVAGRAKQQEKQNSDMSRSPLYRISGQ